MLASDAKNCVANHAVARSVYSDLTSFSAVASALKSHTYLLGSYIEPDDGKEAEEEAEEMLQ